MPVKKYLKIIKLGDKELTSKRSSRQASGRPFLSYSIW